MSVELYPDHKAILHFQNSLKVYEIDFLDYLTEFLLRDEYAKRHFEIYVKPTLGYSAFDFIVLEPNQAIYGFHTPENLEHYRLSQEIFDYFMEQRLYTLSPSFQRRIQQTIFEKQQEKKESLIKQLFYIYEENFLEEIFEVDGEKSNLITSKDFQKGSSILKKIFSYSKKSSNQLTETETEEIRQRLNPNTNIENYISKSLPRDYEIYAKSKAQAKQKFKGAPGSGKTLLLTKRVIDCANRLKGNGRILVISGNISKVNALKDLITAEDGRSLQELGIDISSFQELAPTKEKYQAMFIDDGQYLKTSWINYLLEHYLIEMTEENDYEYIVMADEDELPSVPKIFGPYHTLNHDLKRINNMLKNSREIFLSILNGG